ncbi:MAG: hypothetical protein WB791_09870 [Waddliaceae bacterium]
MQERDNAIRAIHGLGGDSLTGGIWKKLVGYRMRSIAEAAMSRLKRIFGDTLFSRLSEVQNVELQLKGFVLNMMTKIGMPSGCMI